MASLQELERRVGNDPASIAFAQLAEEYRRVGRYDDAVRVARAGLTRHPGYLSARVTLGRALVELGELDAATNELDAVLRSAPENLAAIRALADIHQRRGESQDATSAAAPEAAPAMIADVPPEPFPDVPVGVASPEMLPPALDVLPEPEPAEEAHSLDLELQQFTTALEALDALTFDLPETPPAPPRGSQEFDLDGFRFEEDSAPAPVDEWNLEPAASPDAPAALPPDARLPDPPPSPPDPVLEALENWLSALVSDRAERRRD